VNIPKHFLFLALAAMLLVPAGAARAQSTDQSLPTPVLSREISGTIRALDLGDPRLTRHFYAFEAAAGDLIITLTSNNLNGDIDVFTAITFRPLMKTTMYANTQSSEATKGIYLRQHQILILRIEARSPNDDPGTYHIRFGGTFAPFSGGIPVAENTEATEDTSASTKGGRRLSSVGATLPEPVVEKPAAVEEKPAEAKTEESPPAKKTTTARSKKTPVPPRPAARNTRGRARPAPAEPEKKEPSTEPAKTESTTSSRRKRPQPTEKPAEKPAEPEKPKEQEIVAPQPSAHLIIEQKDGTRIDRPMSTVRRVVVEGNIIVIVMKTGRIERVPMSIVVRMSIEPQ
jgi:hypothetical protein